MSIRQIPPSPQTNPSSGQNKGESHTAMALIKTILTKSIQELQNDSSFTVAEVHLKNEKIELDYTRQESSNHPYLTQTQLFLIAKVGEGPTILQGLYPQAFLPLGHSPEQRVLFYEEEGKIKFISNKDLKEVKITPKNITIFPEAIFFQFPESSIFYAIQRNHKRLTLDEICSRYPATTAILFPEFFEKK